MSDTEYDTEYDIEPVEVSDEARMVLSRNIRLWSGIPTATLQLGLPKVSPFASFNRAESVFIANPERLVINPNRVYLTVTPFRLRQEAVLTGALLHEASHARHTLWTPSTAEELEAMTHGVSHQGMPVSKQTLAFAKLLEEPRIEGIMSTQADNIGAYGLGWTMRASAAHLIPTTQLTIDNPDQRIMDLLTSWTLRAGRQLAIAQATPGYRMPTWVGDFGRLLHLELVKHLVQLDSTTDGTVQANVVKRLMTAACCAGTEADSDTFMVDTARDVLDILFPETTGDEDDAPMPGDPMHSPEDEDTDDTEETETPDQQAGDEGDEGDEPAEDGTQDGQGEDDSDEQGEGEGQGQGEADSPADDGSDGEGGEGEGEGEGEDGEGEGSGSGAPAELTPEEQALAKALAELEQAADGETSDEAEAKASEAPPVDPTQAPGAGNGSVKMGGGWREPTPEERGIAKGAEQFLRDLINPSETSRVSLTESPSATIDGAAFAAWKAGGQSSEPHFFRRTRREVTPSPPVKIAILVDVSQSMTSLQKPSALLSWALANAAVDLRNFAGRGVQVESTLIHWGTTARVIQGNGKNLPGLREVSCNDGTSAMGEALGLVEQEIPGFFDESERPEHRLLVQFTDWELFGVNTELQTYLSRAMTSGVNMLSVVPRSYRPRTSVLDSITKKIKVQRGRSAILKYDTRTFVTPATVWSEAKALLQ